MHCRVEFVPMKKKHSLGRYLRFCTGCDPEIAEKIYFRIKFGALTSHFHTSVVKIEISHDSKSLS